MDETGRVCVAWRPSEEREQAVTLAARLDLRAVPLEAVKTPLALVVTPERFELREVGSSAGPVYVDFSALASRRMGKRQPLAKAVGVKGHLPTVLDASAGLGRDAFALAALGCPVRMLERSRVVAALLEDGLQRAASDSRVSAITARMCLVFGDALSLLPALADGERPDVIYLDPMYPQLGKSALKRKEMRLFRELLGEDADAGALLAVARDAARQRVAVKRPPHAPDLQGSPDLSFGGKTTRFDVYFVPTRGERGSS
jgi:16S rRNA (guanine1516-N2)-methyltransferase